jgi:hypothetical protein
MDKYEKILLTSFSVLIALSFIAPTVKAQLQPTPLNLIIIIHTNHITRLWWQPTASIETEIINLGTLASDVTFEYTLLDSRNQTVAQGGFVVFISGLDKKTVSIPISTPPDGEYTFTLKATEPVEAEAKNIVTVETPFYGRAELTITLIFLAASLLICFKRLVHSYTLKTTIFPLNVRLHSIISLKTLMYSQAVLLET